MLAAVEHLDLTSARRLCVGKHPVTDVLGASKFVKEPLGRVLDGACRRVHIGGYGKFQPVGKARAVSVLDGAESVSAKEGVLEWP